MIAIGNAVVATPVRGAANPALPPHGELVKGERVEIYFTFPPSHAAALRGWTLIRSRARTGWVAPGTIKRRPIYMVDASHHNGAMPNWKAVYDADYAVIGLKISQGTSYPYAAWGRKHWGLVRAAAGDQFGISRFRLGYHWGIVKKDPENQVDYFLSLCEAAGGFGPGDLVPVLDLEEGGNEGVTAAEVRAWVQAFTHHMLVKTGWATLLYSGSWTRALKIHDLNEQGGKGLWVAQYGDNLDGDHYKTLGYAFNAADPKDTLFGWQYAAGEASGAKDVNGNVLPYGIPGYGNGDTSIVFCSGFDELRQRWGAGARHL